MSHNIRPNGKAFEFDFPPLRKTRKLDGKNSSNVSSNPPISSLRDSCIIISFDKNRSLQRKKERERKRLHQIYTVLESAILSDIEKLSCKVLPLHLYKCSACAGGEDSDCRESNTWDIRFAKRGRERGKGRRVNFSGEFSTI